MSAALAAGSMRTPLRTRHQVCLILSHLIAHISLFAQRAQRGFPQSNFSALGHGLADWPRELAVCNDALAAPVVLRMKLGIHDCEEQGRAKCDQSHERQPVG